MADKKYTFPKGTTSIPPKELHEVFRKYEIVEIPGTVSEVRTRLTNIDLKSVLKELILHEGTVALNVTIDKSVRYNIPSTLLDIACPGTAPKVVCLSIGLHKAHFCNFCEIEYLQAHTNSDVRYNRFRDLKHFVYLGSTIKNWVHSPFDNIPAGCVIHVENMKMAMSVLKKCDVLKHYVVVDAEEWKDFPAEKLGLTMEAYNPESRILPEQITMREEKKLQLEAEEKEKQEEARNIQKQKMIASIAEKVVALVLKPLVGPNSPDKYRWNENNYHVKAQEDEKTGESLVSIEIILAKNLWDDNWSKSLWSEVKMTATEVAEKINIYAEHFNRLQSFIEENRELIEYHEIRMGGKRTIPLCPTPGISLPFFDSIIVGRVEPATIQEDVKKIKDFADQLENLIIDGKKDFPYGFTIERDC